MISNLSLGRDAVGVCLLGNQLYAVGGYDGYTCLNVAEAYDEQANEWTEVFMILFMYHKGFFLTKHDRCENKSLSNRHWLYFYPLFNNLCNSGNNY